MSRKAVTLIINGVSREVAADPEESLLNALRDGLDLTGAKYGCGEGRCGACTVLVDGETVHSCLRKAGEFVGRQITTIEGLEREGRLHPVQDAFLEVGAFQCGYCTPGMILGAVGLLARSPAPEEAEILDAMKGHVCRCGTYPRIVAAIRRASELMRGGER